MPDRSQIPCIRRSARNGGFTIIELVAVMVMLVILMGVATPVLSNMGDTRGGMAAKILMRDISFAHQHAIATGTITWVRFDTTGDTKWEIRAETGAAGKTNAVLLTDPATGGDFIQNLNTGSFGDIKVLTASFVGTDVNDVPDIGFDWLGRPLTNDAIFLNALGAVTLTGSHVVNVQQETGYVYLP